LLQVKNLTTSFEIDGQWHQVVKGVSFGVRAGECLGIIGESGCGKSVTSLSLMRLIPKPWGRIDQGEVWLEGTEVMGLPPEAFRKLRGQKLAMIFQDPMTSLNPVLTIGEQLFEVLRRQPSPFDLISQAAALLDEVGIADGLTRLKSYPHQLSGGMKQRVMIAMALAARPQVLIADEPTTALDVTIQAQVLALLKSLQARHQMALILITHDLGVVAQVCDHTLVMYGGKAVEQAPTEKLFKSPKHPYTVGLLASIKSLAQPGNKRLATIPGMVPQPGQFGAGCVFSGRCRSCQDRCLTQSPPLEKDGEHSWSCFYPQGA